MVEVILVDGNAAVTNTAHVLDDFLEIFGRFDRVDLGARRHDFVDGSIVEADDGFDHVTRGFIERAFSLAFLDH